jgi:hypothetical protein
MEKKREEKGRGAGEDLTLNIVTFGLGAEFYE